MLKQTYINFRQGFFEGLQTKNSLSELTKALTVIKSILCCFNRHVIFYLSHKFIIYTYGQKYMHVLPNKIYNLLYFFQLILSGHKAIEHIIFDLMLPAKTLLKEFSLRYVNGPNNYSSLG